MTGFSSIVCILFHLLASIGGIRSAKRIVGGSLAYREQFPFIVSLQHAGSHYCGGSLISNQFVVTAAHCFDIPTNLPDSIKAGTDDLSDTGVVVKIKKVNIHPKYDRIIVNYDVAVVELKEPVKFFKGRISSVQLPEYSTSVPLEDGTVAGWGFSNIFFHKKLLKSIDLQVFEDRYCQTLYPTYGEAMFCAGNWIESVCYGDSGGPFVMDNILYGIVSSAPGVCIMFPQIFVKVPLVVDWIKKIAELSQDNYNLSE